MYRISLAFCACVCVCLGLEFIVIYLFVLKPIKNVRCSSSEPSRSSYYLKRIDCVCRTVLDIPRGMELCGRGRLEIVCYLIIFFSFTRDAFKHHNPPSLKAIHISLFSLSSCPGVSESRGHRRFLPPPSLRPHLSNLLFCRFLSVLSL